MKLPKPGAIINEGLLVVAGAVVAALIIGQLPGLREWIKKQWGDA